MPKRCIAKEDSSCYHSKYIHNVVGCKCVQEKNSKVFNNRLMNSPLNQLVNRG
jgi:hypothetical protein